MNTVKHPPVVAAVSTVRRLLVAGGAVMLLAASLAGCDAAGNKPAQKPQFNATDITGANYGQSLSLTDQDGHQRTLADFKGKVVVVFFGYTQCPDVCPTTMLELAQVKKSLGKDGDRLQALFITIDPERDTPAVLKSYMASFDPSFVALRGTVEQTQAVAKDFKVFFAKVPGRTPDSYTMDHTAGSYVIDGDGKVRLFVRYGAGAEALTADLKTLLAAG